MGFEIAVMHLVLEEGDQASDWLERAAQERGGTYFNFIKVDPYLDPLRRDRRFEQIVASLAPK
jgi:hypothetical protein